VILSDPKSKGTPSLLHEGLDQMESKTQESRGTCSLPEMVVDVGVVGSRAAGMRTARLKVSADAPAGYCHCLSRVVDRRFILGEVEKERFVSLLREYEAFCEVKVLTYCLMDNHFHVLVEVPRRPEVLPTAEEVIAKLKRMTGERFVGMVEQQVARYRAAGDTAGEAAFLGRYYARMWDVSAFMHGVKQRFTQWYNLEGNEEREAADESGRPVRGALRREAVVKVLKAKGKLPLGSYLRCRVRYFCDGAVLGSKAFVEGIFRERREWFGERRKSGARRMRGLAGGELFTVRDLRVNVFG
jgi:REP element-mobilizing transposase RayT